MTLRFEGVRFSDGSCAVRRVAADPCDRATLTFESVRELEEDVGSADVSWLGDNFLPRQSPMCDRCGLRRASCGTLGTPGEYCSLACLQAAEAEEAAKTRAVFTVERQPGEQPVPPPCPAAEHHHRIVAGYTCCECGLAGTATERPPAPNCARCGRGLLLGSYPARNGDRCCSKACAVDPINIGELAAQAEAAADADPDLRAVRAIAARIATIAGDPPRPVDGETTIVRTAEEWRRRYPHSLPPSELIDVEPLTMIDVAEPDRYEPTEEADDP
jgi:hypothetical protein